MRVIDLGHVYGLKHIDGPGEEILTYVKREGVGYPGNVGHHPGTNLQEVLRAEIHRTQYLNSQEPDPSNMVVISCARTMLLELELRAARRHGRKLFGLPIEIENIPFCEGCGHIGCEGEHNGRR